MAKNLIVLSACSQIRHTVGGMLKRCAALGIREISYELIVHPNHDPGCLLQSDELLRAQAQRYEKAIVIFDREGCGQEARPARELEEMVERSLNGSGWQDRCAAVAIDPELEIWAWSDSPEVDRILGWFGRIPSLRNWLNDEGYVVGPAVKPERPKEAFEMALQLAGKQRSAAIYAKLAEAVSLRRCEDRSFIRLRDQLTAWFPAPVPG